MGWTSVALTVNLVEFVNFLAKKEAKQTEEEAQERSRVRGSRALGREDLGLSGLVLQRTDDEFAEEGLSFMYLQLAAEMWSSGENICIFMREEKKKEKRNGWLDFQHIHV